MKDDFRSRLLTLPKVYKCCQITKSNPLSLAINDDENKCYYVFQFNNDDTVYGGTIYGRSGLVCWKQLGDLTEESLENLEVHCAEFDADDLPHSYM